MKALNSFIEKLFEPATHPEPSLTEPVQVPIDIGSRYKNLMSLYQPDDKQS